MALDPSGTGSWYPTLPQQPPASACVFGELMACTGVPDNASGVDGDIRVDLDNGNIYSKANGEWVLLEAGTGSTCAPIDGSGSPVGVVTPACDNQIYRSTTGPGFWQATGLTNNDWILWAGVDG